MRRRLSTVADVAVSVALVAGVSTSAEPSEIVQAWSIVQIAKAHADAAAPRDNWLALLDLGTDLLYDARGRTRKLQPLDLSHDERYLG